jgi:hypothetical protein
MDALEVLPPALWLNKGFLLGEAEPSRVVRRKLRMKTPFSVPLRFGVGMPPYPAFALAEWIAVSKPNQVEMTDKEYAWYSGTIGANPRDIDISTAAKIPIIFLDAPQRV